MVCQNRPPPRGVCCRWSTVPMVQRPITKLGHLALCPAYKCVCANPNPKLWVWQVLAGHEGPVAGLAFSPASPLLASASWDHTLRTWDVFAGKGRPPAHLHSEFKSCFLPLYIPSEASMSRDVLAG